MNWNSFITDWGRQYENARYILQYLSSYPVVFSSIGVTDILDPGEMDASQEDWIKLCRKFEHPVDKEFFKPYWIPVGKDSYDYFMDISDKRFPIFESHFFFFEPYRWYKEFLSKDISEILLACDKGIDEKELKEKNNQDHWSRISQFFDERAKLALEGKLGKIK